MLPSLTRHNRIAAAAVAAALLMWDLSMPATLVMLLRRLLQTWKAVFKRIADKRLAFWSAPSIEA